MCLERHTPQCSSSKISTTFPIFATKNAAVRLSTTYRLLACRSWNPSDVRKNWIFSHTPSMVRLRSIDRWWSVNEDGWWIVNRTLLTRVTRASRIVILWSDVVRRNHPRTTTIHHSCVDSDRMKYDRSWYCAWHTFSMKMDGFQQSSFLGMMLLQKVARHSRKWSLSAT